tara:strand:+ start:35 stop:1231 length:1197 start_codon:yes stop_codon:yes gene_type:complete
MADFQFEVEISAKIQELEQALNKATKSTQEAANKIADAVEKQADPAFENLLKTIGKVSAGLFLAEGAFKIGGAAARAFAGDGEGVVQMLNSLPVIGPLVTSFNEFAEALHFASEGATELRDRLFEMETAAKRADQASSALAARIQAQAEEMKALTFDEARIQEELFDDRMRLLEMNHEARLRQIDEERKAESEAIEAAALSLDAQEKAQSESAQRRRDAIKDAEEELEVRRRILAIQLDTAKSVKEQEVAERIEAAEAQEKQEEKARREAFRQEMEDMALRQAAQMSGVAKAEEFRKKKQAEIDAKRDEQMKREQAFLERRKKVEEEIAEAREKAEQAVMSSTASFSTAGGSFTTAATAQVNEAKLLRSISQQSRDFLQQIVNNTAAFAGGGTGLGFA